MKDFFEAQGYRNIKKRILIAILILLGLTIIIGIVYLSTFTKQCTNSDCFTESLSNCEKASWIREDAETSWRYVIKGNAENKKCKVEVRLLKVKQGPAGNEELQGETMICKLEKGETQFPEKNLLSCTGKLKEEMQETIIQNMHSYLLENIGEIQEEFDGV
jgi:hypothetical protein